MNGEIRVDYDKPLGGSRRSKVYQGTADQGRLVAVKTLAPDASLDALLERIERWENIRHQHVLAVYGMSPQSANPPYIVTQYHKHGNIRQYMSAGNNFDRPAFIFDVILGMQFLHSTGIVHGSLRPSQVFVTDDVHACIGDGGMVEIQTTKNSEAHRYYSPEAWKGTISRSSDVFAFAMTAYEIFTSTPPWGVLPEKHIYQHIVYENIRPDRPESDCGMQDHHWDCIDESWQKEGRLRPTFDIIARMWGGHTAGNQSPVSPGSMHSSIGPPAYDDAVAAATSSNPPPRRSMSPTVEPLNIRPRTGRSGSSGSVHFPTPESPNNRLSGSSSPGRLSSPQQRRPASSSGGGDQSFSSVSGHLRPSRSNSILKARQSQLPPRKYAPSLPTTPSRGSYPANTTLTPPASAPAYRHTHSASESIQSWQSEVPPVPVMMQSPWDGRSTLGSGLETGSNISESSNPVLLVQGLQTEVRETRKADEINSYLTRIQHTALQSDRDAQRLVTAGVVPILIQLLKIRGAAGDGLEGVMVALGLVAHDPISANTIYRTNTATTLIEIFRSSLNDDVATLAIWCLNRICRSADIAIGLLRLGIAKLLTTKLFQSSGTLLSRTAAWCFGGLILNDGIADELEMAGASGSLVSHLGQVTALSTSTPDDICAALYPIARLSRSIKLAKALAKSGCIPLLARHLSSSNDSQVVNWCARAVGCLMRPNSGDMAKALLDAGIATGLARIPSVLPAEEVEPLGSFAFAIQRFSCAEWGGGVRKVLVAAGVVDGLLAALRTASSEPYPQVHIELALAVSFLGDVGGKDLRKEIVNAGGIDILKRVASDGSPEVAKACNLAVTSITGNVWTRNAASAKTAMNHNWSGGCPDFLPPCPFELMDEDPEELDDF